MKIRAAMRDQIPLRRPLFGVEPSGRSIISNGRANFEEWLNTAIFLDVIVEFQPIVVRDSDSAALDATRVAAPKQVSF